MSKSKFNLFLLTLLFFPFNAIHASNPQCLRFLSAVSHVQEKGNWKQYDIFSQLSAKISSCSSKCYFSLRGKLSKNREFSASGLVRVKKDTVTLDILDIRTTGNFLDYSASRTTPTYDFGYASAAMLDGLQQLLLQHPEINTVTIKGRTVLNDQLESRLKKMGFKINLTTLGNGIPIKYRLAILGTSYLILTSGQSSLNLILGLLVGAVGVTSILPTTEYSLTLTRDQILQK